MYLDVICDEDKKRNVFIGLRNVVESCIIITANMEGDKTVIKESDSRSILINENTEKTRLKIRLFQGRFMSA